MNPPAVSGNSVYVATTGHEQTFLYAFDVADGSPKFQATFDAQWPHVLAPTVAAGVVYTNGGYFGGGVYAFDATDGLALWSSFSGDDDMTTPAVADGKVYYYDGTGLKVYDAFSGTTLASVADPYGPGQGYSYHGAPMLGLPDSVTTFSGGAFSGRASSDVEQYDSRLLLNFSVASQNTRWRTASLYKTQPAVANGVVYAAGNNPKSFDAISETTGKVLWNWVPNPTDTEFHRNVVVTRNLAFVSTDKAVYAIDLVSHKPVWSWPTPGSISISGDGYLFIAEGAVQSNGRLHAFKVY
jgi:outer membrane protein assembly factor BamB